MWIPDIDFSKSVRKAQAVADALEAAIHDRTLDVGDRLPPQRELAHRLGISFQTVANAYLVLQKKGLINSVVGRGSHVSSKGTDAPGNFIAAPGSDEQIEMSVTSLPHDRHLAARLGETVLQMTSGSDTSWMDQSRPIAGLRSHREAGSQWLGEMNMGNGSENIFIVNGATQGIFLALFAATRSGETVLSEGLTENGIIGAARLLGLKLRSVETDAEGILPQAMEEACRRDANVTALVWVPSLGNPTVHLARAKRRQEIAAVAERYNIAVIEDEVYRPLLIDDLPSITQLLPEKGFSSTSFTKSVMTGLRVGYLTAPPAFTYRIATALRSTSWSCAPIMSEIASRWIADGTIRTTINQRRVDAEKRQLLATAILGSHIDRSHPVAPHVWVEVPNGWTEHELVEELAQRQIIVAPSAPFAVETGHRHGIRVSLSGLANTDILRESLHVIKSALSRYA